MDEFSGKTAVITGGASGIGFAMARRFGAAGMNLVLGDIEAEALDSAVAELSAAGVVATGVVVDVANKADVERLAEVAMSTYGGVSVVCNNAGVGTGGNSWEISDEDWKWVLDVDLMGVVYGVQVFTPLLIEAGEGHIVNTASMAGLSAPPFMAPYNVAKHGVVALSETLYHELVMAAPNVGVSVVCPGWVRTKIHRSERNRPAAHGASEGAKRTVTASVMSEMLERLIDEGMSPDEVAAQIFDAVRDRQFYVLTHDHWAPGIRARSERMLAGKNPQMLIPTD